MERSQRDSLSFLLVQTNNCLHQLMGQRLKEYGLTLEQWMLLLQLKGCRGASPTDLSQTYHKDRSYTTRLLDRLEERNLLVRQGNRFDKRALKIFLTEKGESLIQQVLPGFQETEQRVRRLLEEPDYEVLIRLLRKMYRSMGV